MLIVRSRKVHEKYLSRGSKNLGLGKPKNLKKPAIEIMMVFSVSFYYSLTRGSLNRTELSPAFRVLRSTSVDNVSVTVCDKEVLLVV